MISVVSGKGGVGKTTVSVGLSRALVRSGKKVLFVDTDWGLCSAEFLIKNTQAVYHAGDLLNETVPFPQAVAKSEGEPDFLAAAHQPFSSEETKRFAALLETYTKDYDYVILDRPAGLDFSLEEALSSVLGLIVSGTDPMSLHGAALGAEGLQRAGVVDTFLILNRFLPTLVKERKAADLDTACNEVGAQLLGVVPEDMSATAYVAQRKQGLSAYEKALERIAHRLMGQQVPLPVLSKILK